MALCSRCHDRLRPAGPTGIGRHSSLDRLLTGWLYEPPLDTVIHALKFARMDFLGRDLAAALHHSFAGVLQEIDVVVPTPLHWFRRVRRGYNQAEAIALPLARRLDRPFVRALRRPRVTRAQARLTRGERKANLRSAFAPRALRKLEIDGQHVLLVDDVVTTGATLESAAACLHLLGAASVSALAAARTPIYRRKTLRPATEKGFLTRGS